jgi:hypothetical protein
MSVKLNHSYTIPYIKPLKPTGDEWIYITFTHSFLETISTPDILDTLIQAHISFIHLSEAKKTISAPLTPRKWIWQVAHPEWKAILKHPSTLTRHTLIKALSPKDQWYYDEITQQIQLWTPAKQAPPPQSTPESPPKITQSPPITPSPHTLKTLEEIAEEACKKHLTDPLSLLPLSNAVITPYGHTFENDTIRHHLSKTPTDPLAKLPLTADQLIPNLTLCLIIHQLPQLLTGKKRALLCPYQTLPFDDPVIINSTLPEGQYLLSLTHPHQRPLFMEGVSYNRSVFTDFPIPNPPPTLLIPNHLLAQFIENLVKIS